MVEDIKVMLGDAANNFTDAQIEIALRYAKAEIEAYTNRKVDTELEMIVARVAIIKLNRTNTEGLISQSMSGISENYIDGYPQDILAVLNRKRKLKII